MTYAQTLLPEFDQEMANTRKVLAQIPDDKFDWRAHPKSNTIGWNANHLADMPSWAVNILTQDELDVAPVGGEPWSMPNATTTKDVLDMFDKNVAAARTAIESVSEADLPKTWSLLQAGQPIFTMPRAAVIRGFVMNHMIHHRAHLCVYLRLNDIPVPGMYGPTGDETTDAK